MTNEQTAIRITYFSIVGNAGLAIIKGFAGFFGNSYALIADASATASLRVISIDDIPFATSASKIPRLIRTSERTIVTAFTVCG